MTILRMKMMNKAIYRLQIIRRSVMQGAFLIFLLIGFCHSTYARGLKCPSWDHKLFHAEVVEKDSCASGLAFENERGNRCVHPDDRNDLNDEIVFVGSKVNVCLDSEDGKIVDIFKAKARSLF